MPETAAAAVAAIEAITLQEVVAFAAKVVISAVVMRALSPKPPSLDFTQAARARKTAIRNSVASRTVVYGTARVAGPLVYAGSTGGQSEYLHLVMPLAGHECSAIDDVYLSDMLSTDARFTTSSTSQNHKVVDWTLSGTYAGGETVSVTIAGEVFSTSGQGSLAATVATLVSAAQASSTHGATITSPSSLVLRATDGFAGRDFGVSSSAGPSMAWTVTTVTEATTTTTTDVVRVSKHLGYASQTADSDLAAESTEWTAEHRLRGVAYMYIRLKWDSTAFPTGMPSPSAVVRGRKIYDPRTATTAHSNNAALCILDYIRNASFGLGAADDEIDFDSFISAASICDEPVAVKAGGTQARYTCDGVIDLAQRPDDIIEQMLTSCDGRLVYSNGRYRLHVATWDAPAWSLDEDDLRGEMRVRPKTQRAALFNKLKGTYIDPNQRWEPADYPPQTNAAWAVEDGGETITRDLALPFTIDPSRAQRIAKIVISRSRYSMTVEMPCKLTAMPVAVWDVVEVTSASLGWSAKQFRVLSWSLSDDGGVDLLLQEEASSIYTWTAATDEITIGAAPDTTLPDLSAVAPPTAMQVVSSPLITAEGVQIPRLNVTWTASADAFLAGYQIQYKASTETEYLSGFPLAIVTESTIAYLDSGTSYDVRIRAVNGRGAVSTWVEVARTTASGDTTAPGVPTSPSATGGSGQITIGWTAPSDADFTRVTIWEHTSNDSGAATLYTTVYGLPAAAGSYVRTGLGSGVTRYYWIKALDASGNASAFSTGVNATTT